MRTRSGPARTRFSDVSATSGLARTKTIESSFAILKRGINGIYQYVSEAHLHRYLAEFDFRYSNRNALARP